MYCSPGSLVRGPQRLGVFIVGIVINIEPTNDGIKRDKNDDAPVWDVTIIGNDGIRSTWYDCHLEVISEAG